MNWYYGINEQQFGPVDIAALQTLVDQGTLGPLDLVWNPSFGDKWMEAQTVSELKFSSSPAPSIAPPGIPAAVSRPAQPQHQEPMGFIENSELNRRARASLSGKWGLGVGITLINILLTQLLSNLIPVLGPMMVFIITGPLTVGISLVFLNIARGYQADVGQMFEGFKIFGQALAAYFLILVFTILWTLLFIIPGIIAGISYSMTYFIIVDNPGIESSAAIGLSKEMMRGYKWQYFFLGFRFLGWMLLSMLTLGIGLLWVIPYMNTSYAHFYEMVRRNYRPELS